MSHPVNKHVKSAAYLTPAYSNQPKGINYLKLKIVNLYFLFANLLIIATQSVLFRKNDVPSKILLFRTGSLGDSICAIPSILSIRRSFPDAKLILLTNAGGENLVSLPQLLNHQTYDEVIDYHGKKLPEISSALRAEKFDLVIELSQYQAPLFRQIRNMLFFRWILKIPAGFGWDAASCMFFRQTQEKYIRYPNERERLLAVLKKNHVAPGAESIFDLQIRKQDIQKVEETFASTIPKNHKPAIGIVVGAKRPQNRWPLAYFLEVIQHYTGEYNILLIGGPEDIPLAHPLSDLPSVYSFCGKLSPVQSYLMLQKCLLVISNDTGPMHLAYAAGVPLVAIFSSRDFPNRWFPPEKDSNVVLRNNEVHCSLCLTETCMNNICMQGIPPGRVIKAADTIIRKLSPASS